MSYRIGNCVISPSARRVYVAGNDVRLGGRAFDLLVALLERRDRVVPSSELYDLIWPGVAIEPNNLQVQIWALRRLLGKDAVATVPRRGYRLTAEVDVLTEHLRPTAPRIEPIKLSATEAATGTTQDEEPTVGHLAGLVMHHRVVTLTGGDRDRRVAAARAVAARLVARLPGGSWRIPCGSDQDPRFLKGLDELPSALSSQPALLIFEECRQAARVISSAVAKVIEVAPMVRILATATVALCHVDEHLVALPNAPQAQMSPMDDDTGLRWRSRGR